MDSLALHPFMKIYRCLRNNSITQKFGVENTHSSVLPVYLAMGLKGHEGFDMAANCVNYNVKIGGQCEPVYYDVDISAKITYMQKDVKDGFGIIAVSEDKDGFMKHLWWHFDSINPKLIVGSIIESGDFLGIAGTTGSSTAPHVHRGLYPFTEPYNNGYHGAVSIEPHFTNIFILDIIENLKTKVGILEKLISLIKQLKLFK